MHWPRPFQVLALAEFSVSVTCHFVTITGMVETFPSTVMLLHGGVFIVFIPAATWETVSPKASLETMFGRSSWSGVPLG